MPKLGTAPRGGFGLEVGILLFWVACTACTPLTAVAEESGPVLLQLDDTTVPQDSTVTQMSLTL